MIYDSGVFFDNVVETIEDVRKSAFTKVIKTLTCNFGAKYYVSVYPDGLADVIIDLFTIEESLSTGETNFHTPICSVYVSKPDYVVKIEGKELRQVVYSVVTQPCTLTGDQFQGLSKIINQDYLKSEYEQYTV
jgi:hypothetical protein